MLLIWRSIPTLLKYSMWCRAIEAITDYGSLPLLFPSSFVFQDAAGVLLFFNRNGKVSFISFSDWIYKSDGLWQGQMSSNDVIFTLWCWSAAAILVQFYELPSEFVERIYLLISHNASEQPKAHKLDSWGCWFTPRNSVGRFDNSNTTQD